MESFMKSKFILATAVMSLVSCTQKEIRVSRSDVSIQKEITGFSPAYIEAGEEGKPRLNRNNLIGNTHWVLSVDRNLTLKETGIFLQQLAAKKYRSVIHEDTKDIWFVYSDTLHKNNAYVKMPFTSIALAEPPVYELSEGVMSLLVRTVSDVKEAALYHSGVRTYLLSLDKDMSTETFVNILIELEKQKAAERVSAEVYIY